MNWINDIKKQKLYSQCGQESYIKFILGHINVTKGFLVDIGAGDGEHISSTKYFMDNGWKGILIDGDNHGNESVHKAFVTKENICDILKSLNCPIDVDLLSIDIDGNESYIIEEVIKDYSPKLIVSEVNAAFEDCRTIKYNPNHKWSGDDYYGYSFRYGLKLAKDNGYTVIHQSNNQDIYMLRNDLFVGDNNTVEFKCFEPFPRSEGKEWIIIQ